MPYRATLIPWPPDPGDPGTVRVDVLYRSATDEVRRSYTFKGELANRHSIRATVENEKAMLDSTEAERALILERDGADPLSMQCDCGRPGCPLTGKHWTRQRS